MSEHQQHNDFEPPAQDEQDVTVLIKRMQQQLVFLEKKIDFLIEQSKPRPIVHKEKPYEYRQRSEFGRQKSEFGHQKSEFGHQKSEFGHKHHFNKRYEGKKKRFGHESKPFFLKRKDSRER